MNRSQIESQIVTLLRENVAQGSGRPIALDQPLGEQGLGLDSLAVVEFCVAFERAFQVELPDDFFSGRPRLTLSHFAEFALVHSAHQAGVDEDETNSGSNVMAPLRALGERLRRVLYEKQVYHFLKFDLARRAIPVQRAAIDLMFRELSSEDEQAFVTLYGSGERRHKRDRFRQRLAAGFIALGAWHEGRLVAADWLSGRGTYEPSLDLDVRMVSGGSLGVDLQEHPEYQRRGVGLALLANSLQESHRRGFSSQFAIVSADNKRMLTAAIQLVGFERIGGMTRTLRLRIGANLVDLPGHAPAARQVAL